jgi:hypothetical protein
MFSTQNSSDSFVTQSKNPSSFNNGFVQDFQVTFAISIHQLQVLNLSFIQFVYSISKFPTKFYKALQVNLHQKELHS